MMTLSQAVKLIMNACSESIGGEVFILKMPVMRLRDLAEVVVEETCKKNGIDAKTIEIENIGLRAGERRYEELMTHEESISAYDLGHSYVVIPLSFRMGNYDDKYGETKKAEIKSYNSSDSVPIDKEEVRKLILGEELI